MSKRKARREHGRVRYTANVAELTFLECLECFQLRIKRATERVSSAIQQMIRPAESATEAMRSLGVSFEAFTLDEADLIAFNAFSVSAESASLALQRVNRIGFCPADLPEAKTRASHAGCAGCLNYSNNPYLACAIHPLGRPGEVCGDWEVRPPWVADRLAQEGSSGELRQLICRGEVLAQALGDE
jgi:hypothetical protein